MWVESPLHWCGDLMVRHCGSSGNQIEDEMIPVMTEVGCGSQCVIQCGGEVRHRIEGRRH